jgi:CBS domain containing-hemolysin-like protein
LVATSDVLMLLLVVLLVLLNGFFVAAEFAIVKVRSTQLAGRVKKGEARAKRAQHIVDHLDAYLSATQLGITLASLGLGWIGEPAIAHLLESPLAAAGVGSPAVVHTVAFVIAFSIITMMHIIAGELAPKSLAIQRAERVTLLVAGPLHLFYVVFKPFIWALNAMANALLRVFGVKPASEGEMVQSEEELRLIMAEAGRSRAVAKRRADVILRVFQLKDLTARDVMTPRTRMTVLDARRSFEDNHAVAEEAGYTRFPLIDGDVDTVVGMVHYRDLANVARGKAPRKDLNAIKRPVLFVPDSKPVEDVLDEMLRRGVHMAIVTDEHGSTAGLLTLEDIFEELFGEIRDEFDTAEGEPTAMDLGGGHFVLDGLLPLHQVERLLGVELAEEDATTLSGHIVALLGHLPAKGERFKLGPYDGLVRDVARRRIHTVEVWRVPEADDESAE